MEYKLNKSEREVIISEPGIEIELNGILGLPPKTKAIIIFSHGSGSGRFSPRNNFVAQVLQQAGFGTLLLDLLSDKEALNRQNVFDIDLLAERLNLAKNWVISQETLSSQTIGFFGASTGAGAAIKAVAQDPHQVFALVSRGGRPDLAMEALVHIQVPTLLLVGGNDEVVIDLNQKALDKMLCEKEMKIIPGASHLFEENGTLEQVAELATAWFLKWKLK